MHSKTSARTSVISAAALIVSVALSSFSPAAHASAIDLQLRHRFQIPAEALEAALAAFSAQSHIHLVTSGARTRVLSPGVSGELSSQNALAALLRGTGMIFRQVDGETIVIAPAQTAQLRPTQFQLIGNVDPTALATQPTATAAPATAAATELTEVQVTGTRIIRQGYEAPTPVAVVGIQDLTDQANPNINTTLTQEPVFQGSSLNNTSGVSDTSGSQTNLNLRSLGTTRVLVLFDGRRMPSDNTTNVVDVDLIPDAVVQRVDVVTGGASAVYGSDAVAGVVNYVLDTNFTGVKGVVQGGSTGYGDGLSDKISLTAGTTLLGGRLHVLISGDQVYQEEINGTQRPWNTRGVQDIQNPAYNATTNPKVPEYMYEPCCVAISGYYPGGIVVSGPLKGTDFGVGGQVGEYSYGSLISGTYNVGGDWQSATFAGGEDILPSLDATHFFGRLAYDITENIQAYAETINSADRTDARCCWSYYPSGLPVPLSTNNPYMPASVAAEAAADGLGSLTIGTSLRFPNSSTNNSTGFGTDATRSDDIYVGGLRGKFGALKTTWNWNLWFQQGIGVISYYVPAQALTQNLDDAISAVTVGSYVGTTSYAYLAPTTGGAKAIQTNPNVPYTAANFPNPLGLAKGTITCASNLLPILAAGETTNCVPYDVFGLNAESQAAYAYALGGPFEREETTQTMGGGDITGEPFSTWAGPVSIDIDAEYRRETNTGFNDTNSINTGYFSTQLIAFTANQHVDEAAIEGVVPVLKDVPFAHELDLNGAARATDYSTSGHVTSWKYGLEWTPINDLRFRATESRDIRAPNLNDLFAAVGINHNTIADPFNGNINAPYYQVSVGNPNLKAEVAHETEIGLVFQPAEIPGFGLTVDWYRINVLNGIGSVSQAFELQECLATQIPGTFTGTSQYCKNIARNPNGSLYSITTQEFNITSQLVEGVDYELDYRTQLARFVTSWLGALDLHVTVNNTMDNTSNTGIPGPAQSLDSAGSSINKWSLRGSLAYDLDPWRFVWTERYYSSTQSITTIECSTNCPSPIPSGFSTLNVDPRIPTYFEAYLAVQYKFMEHDQQEAEAFVSVNNVFNKIPPFTYGSPGPQYGTVGSAGTMDTLGIDISAGVRFRL